MRKRKTRKPRIRVTPDNKLLKEADAVFSRWIRTRDGWTCIVCGATEKIQNGHLFRRHIKALRFNVINCNAQCSSCNFHHNHDDFPYFAKAIQKWGAEAIGKLTEIATNNPVKKIPRSELEDIIRKYS